MSDAKLHHYVPQFYLRRFADSSGQLWVWDRDRDRAFRAKADSVAAENHFYYLEELAEKGHDPLSLEKYLSAMEGDAARITERWLADLRQCKPGERVSIPDEDRNDASVYLATQFLRTADAREIFSTWAEAYEDTGPISPEERRKLHASVLWVNEILDSVAEKIYDSIWVFGRNQTGVPFFTSDNPVAFRNGDNSMWIKVCLDLPGTYMVLPLAPDIIMYGFPKEAPWEKVARFDCALSPVTFAPAMVIGENTAQVFTATRFVISPDGQFEEARAFAKTIGTDLYAEGWRRRREQRRNSN